MKKQDLNNWANQIRKAADIATGILKDFNAIDEQTKKGISMFNDQSKKEVDELEEDGGVTKKDITNVERQFFGFWKGAIFLENEHFWTRIKEEALPFERGETRIQELLRKKRFNSIEPWIQLINNYADLKEAGYVDLQLTQAEQNEIMELMAQQIASCQNILETVLEKGKVGKSIHRKFVNAFTILNDTNKLTEKFDDEAIKKIMSFMS